MAYHSIWSDHPDYFWAFGGSNGGNELWKYNLLSNQWTWINGQNSSTNQSSSYGITGIPDPSNMPGSRWGCANWTDNSGNLLLYGGIGYGISSTTQTELIDLWKYDINSNTYACIKGNGLLWQPGSYGVQGVSSPLNYPSARETAQSWRDINGDFCLFGGQGVSLFSPSIGIGELGDVWKLAFCTSSMLTIKGNNNPICAGETAVLSLSGINTFTIFDYFFSEMSFKATSHFPFCNYSNL